MIYAYAVCDKEAVDPPPRRRGLGGAALRVTAVDGLAAVYSRHRTLQPRPSRTHERTVEAVMDAGAVLPMRFGTVLPDESALSQALAARRAELSSRLRLVRGRVELGLRVMPRRPAQRHASGRDYLLGRVQEQRDARELQEALTPLASETRVRRHATPPALLAAAYLVDRDDVPAFRARVEELAAAYPGIRAICSGPWPPYSFAAEEDT
jgi:Gas vesicle synthesis protein GvpL/GvpF